MARYITRCCYAYLESRHRHDFVPCPCERTFVDGGDEYHRTGGYAMPIWLGPSLPLRLEE